MIALQERVHDELPVRGDVMGASAEEILAGQVEGVEIMPERLGFREIRSLVEREPDQAARLARRQALQAESRLVEAGKAVGARQSGELPVQRIAPGVIGADQARGADRLVPLDQPRAAMLADIQEDMGDAVAIARDQQRLAEAVMRYRHIGFGEQGRRRDHQRQSCEDPFLFGDMARGIGIGGRIDMGDAGAAPGAARRQPRGKGELACRRHQMIGQMRVHGCPSLFLPLVSARTRRGARCEWMVVVERGGSWWDGIRPYFEKAPLAALALGISSGFPYAMIGATLTTRLAQDGIDKKTVTAFSLAFLVYNLKWIWAWVVDGVRLPVIGALGQRVSWLIVAGVLVMAAVANLALIDPKADIMATAVAAILVGAAGATFDIVIDAYRIEILEPRQLGVGSGMSQYGWRIGSAGAGALALVIAARGGWEYAYLACALLALPAMLAGLIVGEPARHREIAKRRDLGTVFQSIWGPFAQFFMREGAPSCWPSS